MEETTKGTMQPDHNWAQSRLNDELTSISLHDLPQLSRAEMGKLWEELVRTPVPKSLSLPLMLRFVAFELQAREQGGLPNGFVDGLVRRVADAGHRTVTPTKLRPGGRLLREWNGITHVVDIIEGGFVWRNTTYASLSAIAREITGAHWSGPCFFGLTTPASASGGTKTRSSGSRTGQAAR